MPWRKSPSTRDDDVEATRPAESEQGAARSHESPEGFAARLRERGVTSPDALDLAQRMIPDLMRRQPSARESYLDGVASCWHATQDTRAELDQSITGIKEVERLMGAFSGELSKLDEVLEVLAAYVRRMRSSNGETSEGQTLH